MKVCKKSLMLHSFLSNFFIIKKNKNYKSIKLNSKKSVRNDECYILFSLTFL
jgi:hypothetical protein